MKSSWSLALVFWSFIDASLSCICGTVMACLVLGTKGRGKGAPGVYCMHMRINFLKNCITNRHLHYTNFCFNDVCHQPHSVWTILRKRHIALNFLLAGIMHALLQLNTMTLNDAIFLLKFTDRLEQSDADHRCQGDFISAYQMCHTGSMHIALQ